MPTPWDAFYKQVLRRKKMINVACRRMGKMIINGVFQVPDMYKKLLKDRRGYVGCFPLWLLILILIWAIIGMLYKGCGCDKIDWEHVDDISAYVVTIIFWGGILILVIYGIVAFFKR